MAGPSPTSQASGLVHRLLPAALVLVWLLVAAAHLAAPPALRLRTWPLGYGLLTALACASLTRRALVTPGPGQLAWWLLAGSTLADTLSLALTSLQAQGFNLPAFNAQIARLDVITVVLVVAGVLTFPVPGRAKRGMRWRQLLDSLIFTSSLLFLLWAMGVQASLSSAAQGMGPRVFLAYLNAAVLGGGVVYLTSSRPGTARGPIGWLALSALAWLVSLVCWTVTGLPSTVDAQGWAIVTGCIPLFQGLAAWSPASAEDPGRESDAAWRLIKFFPYLPMTLGIGVLAWLLGWRPGDLTRGTFAIFLVMVVFLLLRMLQAIRDLQASRSTLEQRVAERTRALEKAQETLLHTERMNSMAMLGAGLTHDLNNLLGTIHATADLMRLDLEQGHAPSARALDRILGSSAKAVQFTRRLMTFGRREAGLPGPALCLADMVASTRELLAMVAGPIPLTFDLDAGTCPVQVDPAILEQVLVNLVSNAKDAMPQGGAVTIRLRPGVLAGGGPAAILEVADTGPGIPLELQGVIFDAFFTTKPEGKGTGLGLASVRALMAVQKGTVAVESAPGAGTTFRLAFPG